MRCLAAAVALAGLLAAAPARAAVTVGAFSAPDDLAIFAPEVSRAVAVALDRAGVEVTPRGGTPVTGAIEALGGERVRLKATTQGKTAQVEGDVEHLDEAVLDLSARLVPLVPAATKPTLAATTRPPVVASVNRPRPVDTRPVPLPVTTATTANGGDHVAPPPAPSPAPADPAAPPPATTTTVATTETPPPPSPPRPTDTPPLDPYAPSRYAPPPPVYGSYPRPRSPWGAQTMGSVVLHGFWGPAGCLPRQDGSNGAARFFFSSTMHMRVLSGPCGPASPSQAAAEAVRVNARAVVMGSFDDFRIDPNGMYPMLTLRLHVVVIGADGEVLFDRSLEPESRNLDGSRSAVGFATYDLTIASLDSIRAKLASVLAGP